MTTKQTSLAVQASPLDMIGQIIAATNGDTAKLGEAALAIRELVALQQSQERFQWEREERQAKIDFDDALNRCQKSIGRIAPNQNRTDTRSWWADYAQLDRAVRPIYTEEGFSIAFREVPSISTGKVRIEAEVSRGGISKHYHSEITPTTTGPKGNAMATATDADAIAQSRAKRYIMLDIFNIAIGIDKDEKQGISPDDADALKGLVDQMNQSETLEDGREAYKKAYKMARDMKNNEATLKVIDAWEKCQKEFAKS